MPFFPNKQTVARIQRYSPYGAAMALQMARFNSTKVNQAVRHGDSYTLTQTKKKRKYGQTTSFKDKLFNAMSARHDTGEQSLGMTHNTLYTLNLTARITQGDSNSTRDGDAIVLCGLKMKGYYNSHTTANAYGFRIIVGYSGEEHSNTTFGSGLGSAEIFLPNTATITTTNGQINPKAFTVLYDEKLTANSQIPDVRDRVDFNFHVPLNNKLFQYQTQNPALGKDTNLYVVVVSDVILGTTGTTISGGFNITWDFVYKNAN